MKIQRSTIERALVAVALVLGAVGSWLLIFWVVISVADPNQAPEINRGLAWVLCPFLSTVLWVFAGVAVKVVWAKAGDLLTKHNQNHEENS